MFGFAEFKFDADRRELSTTTETVQLRPKTAQLLQLFLEHPGEVLTKQTILDLVWGESSVTESSLYECMNDVRGVLKDSSSEPRFIKTVPRKGYCWVWCGPSKELPAPRAKESATESRGKRMRRNWIWSASGMAVILAGLAWFTFGQAAKPDHRVTDLPGLSICGQAEEAYRRNRMATAVALYNQCENLATHQQLHLAWAYLGLSKPGDARRIGEQVLGEADQRNDLDLTGKANRLLSRVASYREDYPLAREHFLGYLETLKERGQDLELAFGLYDLALLSTNFGDVDQGESVALSALARARDLGLESLEPRLHLLLADVAWQRRNLADWHRWMESSMTLLLGDNHQIRRDLIWADMNRLLPLALMKDRDSRAEQFFNSLSDLLEQLPEPSTQRFFLAQIAARNAHHEDAYQWLQQSLETNDPLESASHALYFSMSALAAGKLEDAQHHRRFILDQYTSLQESAQAKFSLMRWAYIAGEFGYWEEAESTLRQVLSLREPVSDFDVNASLRLGWVLLMRGKYSEVYRLSETLLADGGETLSEHQLFYAQFLKASLLFMQRRYDQAELLCESLVARNAGLYRRVYPRDAHLLILRFRLRLIRHQWDQAKLLIDSIAGLAPHAYNDPRSLNLFRAEYHLARGEDDLALPLLRATVEARPWYQGMFPMLAEPNLLLARLYHRRGQWEQGRSIMERALRRGTDHFETLLLAAHYQQAVGNRQQAVTFSQQARKAGNEAWSPTHQASFLEIAGH